MEGNPDAGDNGATDVSRSQPNGPPHVLAEMSTGLGQQLALAVGTSGDAMSRFEALSRAFKEELEGLVDEEKAASKVTVGQLQVHVQNLEKQLEDIRGAADTLTCRLAEHVSQYHSASIEAILGGKRQEGSEDWREEGTEEERGVGKLQRVLHAFLQVAEAAEKPELDAANAEISRLKAQVAARDLEVASLNDELREAKLLKTQEERELCEFQALREKESVLRETHLKLGQAESQLQELRASQKLLVGQVAQCEATMGDKSRKVVELMQELEKQVEHCKALADENNTLRLQLGKDNDYAQVRKPAEDPLQGDTSQPLCPELQQELRRLEEELAMSQLKFPGLQTGSENCRAWCSVQIARQADLYRSFLHRLQDFSKMVPGVSLEFVSKAKEIDAAWLRREDEMKDEDAAFQELEKEQAKSFECRRVELVNERDAKIKQLMEQAEKSQTKAEKQLLLQQAKLFGQRIDTKIEQLWNEQREAREERWAKHNQAKQESRQRFRDETLSVQQQADGATSAADRFQDMAQTRLSGVEDAWLRNLEKVCSVSGTVLKGSDVEECLRSAGLEFRSVPALEEGSQFIGVGPLSDATEELLAARIAGRRRVHKELEDQTIQQLRACVEKFLVKEVSSGGSCSSSMMQSGAALDDDAALPNPECSQAKVVESLLRGRQHRMVAETIQRQFYDFLLVLRVASLGAARLMPTRLAESYRSKGTKLDLPSLTKELHGEMSIGQTSPEAADGDEQHMLAAADVRVSEEQEGKLMYESLMRRLLERLLSPMHTQHREELLALKRDHAREVRQVLQHHCQLEAHAVDKAIEVDVDEFRCQVKTRLETECEQQVCEQRHQLRDRTEEQVEQQVRHYRRVVIQEEIVMLKDRRKWVTERLVVLQTQGVGHSGDKFLLQHLRAELRVLDLKVEQRERELAEMLGASQEGKPWRTPQPQPSTSRSSSPRPKVDGEEAQMEEQEEEQEELASAWVSEVQQSEVRQPAQARRPSKPSSSRRPGSCRGPSPHRSSALPIGRPSGTASVQQQAVPSHYEQASPRADHQDFNVTTSSFASSAEEIQIPPRFGGTSSDAPVAPQGDAGRQRAGPQQHHIQQKQQQQQHRLQPPTNPASPRISTPSFGSAPEPLYEWPFDNVPRKFAADPSDLKSVRSLSASKHQLTESLPPLKSHHQQQREEMSSAGATATGMSYSFPATGSCSLKSPRHVPPLLPSMPTPRAR